MPSLWVEQDGKTTRVFLGPLRYLVEQNFSPKAGSLVEVRGFRSEDEVVALTVTLPGTKTLRLRDQRGCPVWAGGRHGNAGCAAPWPFCKGRCADAGGVTAQR